MLCIAEERIRAKEHAEKWLKKLGVMHVVAQFREKFDKNWLIVSNNNELRAIYKACVDKHKQVSVHGTVSNTVYASAILKSKLIEKGYPLD